MKNTPVATTKGIGTGGAIPQGGVIMWSGSIASIPAGWALCDGNNGTPNLVDHFVVCAKEDEGGVAKTKITGSLRQSGGATSHCHLVDCYTSYNTDYIDNWAGESDDKAAEVNHRHEVQGNTDYDYTLPPYYALAYIMKL